MNKVQTDNSYLKNKIALRLNNLPAKNDLKILDIYGGDGLIWESIKLNCNKKLSIVRIDKKTDKKGIYLKGDNNKFISNIELDSFDIIDIDAYGIPYIQLKNIFLKKYKGIIFITFIQSIFGKLPIGMLNELGYSKEMVEKIPSLFNQNGLSKFTNWLSIYGISRCKVISFSRKHYLVINYKG